MSENLQAENAEPPPEFNDARLVEWSIRQLVKPPTTKRQSTCYLWVKVRNRFAVGSTTAHRLCARFGLDPDMEVRIRSW